MFSVCPAELLVRALLLSAKRTTPFAQPDNVRYTSQSPHASSRMHYGQRHDLPRNDVRWLARISTPVTRNTLSQINSGPSFHHFGALSTHPTGKLCPFTLLLTGPCRCALRNTPSMARNPSVRSTRVWPSSSAISIRGCSLRRRKSPQTHREFPYISLYVTFCNFSKMCRISVPSGVVYAKSLHVSTESHYLGLLLI